MERTLAIIKPDAVRKKLIGKVVDHILNAGLDIAAMKMKYLTKAEAEGFYAVHKGKGFYNELTDFMSSGPCVVLVLKGEGAIKRWRELMGATNPANAAAGTIRKQWADNVQENIVHGSDAPETAAYEIGYFFTGMELFGK